jgi:hypothetical protein
MSGSNIFETNFNTVFLNIISATHIENFDEKLHLKELTHAIYYLLNNVNCINDSTNSVESVLAAIKHDLSLAKQKKSELNSLRLPYEYFPVDDTEKFSSNSKITYIWGQFFEYMARTTTPKSKQNILFIKCMINIKASATFYTFLLKPPTAGISEDIKSEIIKQILKAFVPRLQDGSIKDPFIEHTYENAKILISAFEHKKIELKEAFSIAKLDKTFDRSLFQNIACAGKGARDLNCLQLYEDSTDFILTSVTWSDDNNVTYKLLIIKGQKKIIDLIEMVPDTHHLTEMKWSDRLQLTKDVFGKRRSEYEIITVSHISPAEIAMIARNSVLNKKILIRTKGFGPQRSFVYKYKKSISNNDKKRSLPAATVVQPKVSRYE